MRAGTDTFPQATSPLPGKCMVCEKDAASVCHICRDSGVTGCFCGDACFAAAHPINAIAEAHRPRFHPITEEHMLEVCGVHNQRADMVCMHEGCASQLLCNRCVSLDAHQNHRLKHVDDAFLPTKRVVRAQLDTVQAQLAEARESCARAVATLDHLASNFDTEQAAVQVHFDTAVLAHKEGDQRCDVADEEEELRGRLYLHEARARKKQLRATPHLQQEERLVRQGIAATHELLHEKYLRLFRAREHIILCEHYIKQLTPVVPQLEATLALPEKMPRTLQHRSARLSALCTAEAVPPESCVSLDVPSVRLLVKAPAVYDAEGVLVASVGLSPCGRLSCVGTCGGGDVFVFDTTTAEKVVQLKHGDSAHDCVAFSRCGKWLASASRDKTVAVFCTATWERIHTLQGHTDEVRAAAWTHTGCLVTGSQDQSLRVWDVVQGVCAHERKQAVPADFFTIAVSHTSIFATAPDTKTIHEWDVNTLQHTHSLVGHTEDVLQVALTTDETQLVSCSYDKSVKVWCTTTRTCLLTMGCGLGQKPPKRACTDSGELLRVAVSQEGDVVAIVSETKVHLLKLSTGECVGTLPVSECRAIALSTCGRWVFTGGDGHMQVTAVATCNTMDVTLPTHSLRCCHCPACCCEPHV
eukprot:TRINITY_DN879_c0_g1_i2.p1 TRINITY_DN879_c0_g1~~TRINITY_DN879_c0_g1_i2.p1  ORF type:complete len:650 (+),score=179.11 TRINITY_DN879_c0_g1_i2:33-1952(+)